MALFLTSLAVKESCRFRAILLSPARCHAIPARVPRCLAAERSQAGFTAAVKSGAAATGVSAGTGGAAPRWRGSLSGHRRRHSGSNLKDGSGGAG